MAENEFDIMPISLSSPIIEINKTYSYIDSPTFYSLANPNYFDFYNRTVRYWGYWLDGWVPAFHNQNTGVFSTGICAAVVNSVSNQIAGQRILFEKIGEHDDNDTVSFITKWSDESGLQQRYTEAIQYSCGLGTSLLKLNVSAGKVWFETLRFDYFFPQWDAQRELEKVTCLVRPFTNASQAGVTNIENYYLVEKRYYEYESVVEAQFINGEKKMVKQTKKVPYVVYQVHKTGGISSQNTMTPNDSPIRFEHLPEWVKREIKKSYTVIELGKPQRLPFNTLGCWTCPYEPDVSRPNSPFGRSISANLMSDYMVYDKTYSWKYRDEYLGKGTLLVPKAMDMASGWGVTQGIGEMNYSLIPTIDPENQKPINIQFAIRQQEWAETLNDCIKSMAMKIGINTSTLAAHIAGEGHLKTATEVEAEIDLTLAYIEKHRAFITPIFDKMIETVLNYYGREANVKCKFSTPTLVNKDKLIERATALLQAGLLDKASAIRMINPDMDEVQVNELVEKIALEDQKKSQMQSDALMQSYGL